MQCNVSHSSMRSATSQAQSQPQSELDQTQPGDGRRKIWERRARAHVCPLQSSSLSLAGLEKKNMFEISKHEYGWGNYTSVSIVPLTSFQS